MDQIWIVEHWAYWWILANFLIYLAVFGVALCINANFTIMMVGMIYLVPLIPIGWESIIGPRFVLQSIHNMVFGVIELVIFVITVKPADATFDRAHVKQLLGHTLPIAAALIGLSYMSRASSVPLGQFELAIIMAVFVAGSILRVMSVYQLGSQAFKFDIVFREQQTLRTEKLYSWIRHPSYTAMMIVILAYALTTHHWLAGGLGMASAWFGFQYRIHHEEKALQEQFGEDYVAYRNKTGMWLPKLMR
ncbi:MAG: isoprenylcysteine carboxylmethyltransferase family protein [Nitrospinota bacterium]|jgi:protein-S-isoprenylcysteine O-methyltransferase Ste14|nr:isoprenylcysteine carboxylmethyltransferase family protein [Nitrospinota bacterium]